MELNDWELSSIGKIGQSQKTGDRHLTIMEEKGEVRKNVLVYYKF